MKHLLCLFLLLALLLPAASAEAPVSPTHVVCTSSSVNVRSGPGTEFEKLGTISRGVTARLIESGADWHLIEFNSTQAWVSADYVSLTTLVDHLADDEIQAALQLAELCPPMGMLSSGHSIPVYAVPASGQPIGELDPGVAYPVYERRNGFLRVLDYDSFVWVAVGAAENFTIFDTLTLNNDFSARSIDDALKQRINGLSYKSNCTVPYSDLRYVSILYYDFEGNVHRGEIMCNAAVARDMLVIFNVLYQAKYPLTEVSLVDNYGAVDRSSMSANNTSCFNFRLISGSDKLSNHALGLAIDVNPQINPFVQGSYVSPKNGAPYADRTKNFPGKIDSADLCYQLFMHYGWEWGGVWTRYQDYQHFEKYL